MKALYAQWAKTGECVFYAEDEQLAIGDTMICSIVTGYQPKPGVLLRAAGFDVDHPGPMYIYKAVEEMVWPFNERGRVGGKDVWEPNPDRAEIIKLDRADVITAEEVRQLLDPTSRHSRRSMRSSWGASRYGDSTPSKPSSV